ncbi:hypothetical protein ABT282_07265 [Streptomyces sp. NPDC000927]|uniref:hypothetical protein n=1 Tax=Streptomyces sp. NPDC000927 TaxID=3154371 RepID=UPI003331E772
MGADELCFTVRGDDSWKSMSKSRLLAERRYHKAFIASGGIKDESDLFRAKYQLDKIERALMALAA